MTRPTKKAPAPRSNALPRAARDGDAAGVVRLLDAGVPVDALDDDARTALDLAAQENHADVVRVLLAAGADTAAHAGPYHDLTPLTCAAMVGSTDAVAALLDAGVSMGAQDRIPYTPLMLAAGDNRPETVALLIDRGADLEDRSMRGRTALEWAACRGSVESVAVLLERGAEATDTALRCALRHSGRGEEERERYGRVVTALRHARARAAATAPPAAAPPSASPPDTVPPAAGRAAG
ncbi:ankyrin repeat domain-containing protein [Streptomyces sp. PB17]|uniref:ankyrin repeat domain-containing protein n=1 Tax=Streptomyces sp. PB17 TaxID=3384158 RepID=UPI0038B550AB